MFSNFIARHRKVISHMKIYNMNIQFPAKAIYHAQKNSREEHELFSSVLITVLSYFYFPFMSLKYLLAHNLTAFSVSTNKISQGIPGPMFLK